MAVLPRTNLKSYRNKCTFIKFTSNKHRSSILSDPPQIFTENIIPLEKDDMLSCEGKVTQEECLKPFC